MKIVPGSGIRESGAKKGFPRLFPHFTGFRITPLSHLAAFCSLSLVLTLMPLTAQPLTPIAQAPEFKAKADSLNTDSLAAAKPPLRADTARVVMHHFNHRQQLITGGAIMATMISIMVVMNNYNPRVPQ